MPEHVATRPGSKLVGVQMIPPTIGSLTPIALTVTLPVLVTTKEYVMGSPTTAKVGLVVDFTTVSAGAWSPGTITVLEEAGAIGVPLGGVPTTEAVLVIDPVLRSAKVTTCVAVQMVDAPGARVVTGQEMPVT